MTKRQEKLPSMQRVIALSWHVCEAELCIQLQGKSYRCTFVHNFRACFGKYDLFKSFNLADRSGSVCRELDWGLKGCLFESLPSESLCWVLEQDTLSTA